MLFTLNELVQWLGLTIFEIWINLLAITLFTILLALRLENIITGGSAWWIVFAPLFAADGLNAYFCTIVYIRMQLERLYKVALFRVSWSFLFLVLLFVFKFLLCQKLSGQGHHEYSEVLAPIFILLQLIMVRACQMH
ncbi:transmembrane protein 203 [Zootermopsis nevadensis]|uniref:Transmembrane protein 203 n=1 Tax=Zootermopsis nevadensis TaxID=136037 RepID=A0A067RE68_ZOONE|nr:transmembrane protein 203 [Zootermopsis nevadensis]KDR22131.1 hypothetical protein L798_02095 [Zootermopsis nevadensis]